MLSRYALSTSTFALIITAWPNRLLEGLWLRDARPCWQHTPGSLSVEPLWLASTLWLCCSMAYEPFGGLKSTTKAVRAGKARHSVKIEYRTPVQQETAQQAEKAVQEVERQAVDLELLYFAFDILYYDGQARCSAPSQQPVSVVVSARVSVVAGSAYPRSGLACKVDASCLRHEAVSSTA